MRKREVRRQKKEFRIQKKRTSNIQSRQVGIQHRIKEILNTEKEERINDEVLMTNNGKSVFSSFKEHLSEIQKGGTRCVVIKESPDFTSGAMVNGGHGPPYLRTPA